MNLITTFASLDFFRSFFIAQIDNIKSNLVKVRSSSEKKRELSCELKMNLCDKKKSQQPAEPNFNWTFFSPLQVHLSFAPHGEGAGSMEKRQCAAINSASRFFVSSESYPARLDPTRRRLTMIVNRWLQLASTNIQLLRCCRSDHPHHMCVLCAEYREKYITFKWIYFIYFRFFTLFLLSCGQLCFREFRSLAKGENDEKSTAND